MCPRLQTTRCRKSFETVPRQTCNWSLIDDQSVRVRCSGDLFMTPFTICSFMSKSKLPASLTSVYRLCLRASSASVLHHRVAAANLRRLLRPTFDAAANVTKQLQNGPSNTDEQAQLKAWLNTWEERMDTTLSLLYTSSQSRGLPHKLTRNLSFLVLSEHQRLIKHHPQKAWEPQIHAASTPKPPDLRKEEREKRLEDFVSNAWAPLSQVVKLAEGRDCLSLGRLTVATMNRRRRFK